MTKATADCNLPSVTVTLMPEIQMNGTLLTVTLLIITLITVTSMTVISMILTQMTRTLVTITPLTVPPDDCHINDCKLLIKTSMTVILVHNNRNKKTNVLSYCL